MAPALPHSLWHTLGSGKCRVEHFTLALAVFFISNKCRFAEKVLKAVKGEKGLVEPSYVYLPGIPGGDEIAKKTGVEFFSVPVELGVSLLSIAPTPTYMKLGSHYLF